MDPNPPSAAPNAPLSSRPGDVRLVRPLTGSLDTLCETAATAAPYLRRLIEGAGLALDRVEDAPEALDALLADIRALAAAPRPDEAARLLRQAKRRAHLLIALADLSGLWPLETVTGALTDLADTTVQAALATALARRGLAPEGLFLVALGKMGARELNYSSDVDMAAYYDPDLFRGGDRGPADAAARVCRDVVDLMESQTADGYVFRTDFRLRPDPRSTPIAVSTRMAELYYESVGQNWERMVWIKARACAGDCEAAEAFFEVMRPFVWRRHLDYWAIADIHAIKRMINANVGDPDLGDLAADVKLGPGGIREIEFFVQTQQLILGGRDPALRDPTTLGALKALGAAGVLDSATVETLNSAYHDLRAVEHRIQMLDDAQTHSLPADREKRARVAALCGWSDLSAFDAALVALRTQVHDAYRTLFAEEERRTEAAVRGNLVFTGVDDDPGTLATLAALGFSAPDRIIATIRDWHRGGVPATRTQRGQQLLTAILPDLLGAMGRTGEADVAFARFTTFFEGLRTGVQTLSMLLAEPQLLDDLVATLALAPRLASRLAQRPVLLEALVDGGEGADLDIPEETPFDEAMDRARRHHRDQVFLIGHRLLHGRLNAVDAAGAWTALADRTIQAMAAAAARETVRRFGPPPGRYTVLGMGKLGGQEMTAGSDLDLLVVYAADDAVDAAGEARHWFAKYTQRLITALSAPTPEGVLYEVDMRLRPSGRSGPVAVHVPAFERYQREEAWTWEHMALTRMRPVAGDEALGRDVLALGRAALASRTDRAVITADIVEMRDRLRRERPQSGPWDLKFAPGGLVDIEFVVQHALLISGDPGLVRPGTREAIASLDAAGQLSSRESDTLLSALTLIQAVQQVLRLAVGDEVQPATLSEGLRNRLCRAAGVDTFDGLVAALETAMAAAAALHRKKLPPTATET